MCMVQKMALILKKTNNETVSQWVDYKDEDGKTLASFKIKNKGNNAYKVARGRLENGLYANGFDIATVTDQHKTHSRLLAELTAYHLLEDWKGISVDVDGEIQENPKYSPELAADIIAMPVGVEIWGFIEDEAEKLQEEIDKKNAETMGESEIITGGQSDTED